MMTTSSPGLRGWILQRFSALYLGIYIVSLVVYCFSFSDLTYETWHALFNFTWMRVATLITLIMIAVHAWLGLKIIATDYIKKTCLRILFLGVVNILLLSYVVWGFAILWG